MLPRVVFQLCEGTCLYDRISVHLGPALAVLLMNGEAFDNGAVFEQSHQGGSDPGTPNEADITRVHHIARVRLRSMSNLYNSLAFPS